MKKLSFLFLTVTAIFIMSFTATQQKKKVVFFGDSITQAGVSPIGYITALQKMLVKDKKDNAFELIGAGIGGNKVYDLYLRLEDDVLSKKPDLVFIYVGINDVWHKRTYGTGTDADKYEKFYNALIDKIQKAGAKVVICTPTVIGEKKNNVNELDGDLNKYSEIIRGIAKNKNVELLDLRSAMTQYLGKNNPQDLYKDVLTTDGVHLNEKGNQFLADQFYPFIK